MCIIGDGIFKFFRLQEGTFKGIPNQLNKMREASNQNYLCHTWLNDDRLVVCSEAGDILLFDSGGEFKMVARHHSCKTECLQTLFQNVGNILSAIKHVFHMSKVYVPTWI